MRLIDSTNTWDGKSFGFTKKNELSFSFNYDGCKFKNGTPGGQIVAGELYVSKLDFWNDFISGTFWFTAVSDCDTVFVTEGRFDIPFFVQEG